MPGNEQGGNAAQAPQEENKIWGIIKQVLLFYAISQVASRFFASKAPASTNPDPVTGPPGTVSTDGYDPWSRPPTHASLAWPLGQPLDIYVSFTTQPSPFTRSEDGLPTVAWKNIEFGDWRESREVEYNLDMPKSALHNGTLWANVALAKNGASPDPTSPKYSVEDVHLVHKLLTPYLPRIKVRKEHNLLKGTNTTELEVEEPDYIVPHWHSNVTLALVSDATVIPLANFSPVLQPYLKLTSNRDATGTRGFYQPIVYFNDFWHLRSHYMELNETTSTVPLQLTFQPMSYMKFQMFASMSFSFDEAVKQQGATSSADFDEIKRMLLETNPYFLGLTALVTVLHMLFEMLAFKNDVSHWRQKKEMVGVSVRTIILNVVTQLIILLYLIDNNENTSWMILFGNGMGVAIEAWKITKAVDISLAPSPPGSMLPYTIVVKDKHVLSDDEKKTQEFDKLAFRYVSYVAIPTLLGYTVYSLMYQSHRGWYSFIITTLTSFVYMFGFAQLIPQLIINYKLKSVAHMPMKAMIYKTLSTVVDDFFAFCIKMPFLHRLACFRDDLVFLVFLYQRWIYRIDPKRINEYGQIMVDDVDAIATFEDREVSETKETKKTK